jgi:hypothetical protein
VTLLVTGLVRVESTRGEAPGKTAVDQDPMPQPGASLLSYPAAITLSTRTLNHLSDLIRAHRVQRRCRWRRLDPGRQATLNAPSRVWTVLCGTNDLRSSTLSNKFERVDACFELLVAFQHMNHRLAEKTTSQV